MAFCAMAIVGGSGYALALGTKSEGGARSGMTGGPAALN
jgi:hypothetical protein